MKDTKHEIAKLKAEVKELREALHKLRCDFERRAEWLFKGPLGFNYRDPQSEERIRKYGCQR